MKKRVKKSQQQPTPGPWEVFIGGNFVKVVAAGYHQRRAEAESGYLGGPLSVATADYHATEDYSDNHELALANALLMAAAPDMLKALRAVRLFWANNESVKWPEEVERSIDHALRKAQRGR